MLIDDKRFSEEDFRDFVKELTDRKMIEGKAAGITAKVVHDGIESLSGKQRYVLNKEVLEPFYVPSCKRDGIDIPWCEMVEASDNGGYCSWCAHMMEKALAD